MSIFNSLGHFIPRIYTNKPRTNGLGYKGMFHQPDFRKDSDMVSGLEAIRHMHIRVFDESRLAAADIYRKRELSNPAIIVDTNHANSGKLFYEQPRIAKEIMNSRNHSDSLKGVIKGLMFESYLLEGAHEFGKSITDPCLGWDASERLVYDLADMIQ
ncbi:MAG: hypothetical protein FWG92_02920 [Leptospirales bacterium]|nr:hypothetical protein [Leptospirales bacterium]